MESTRAEKYSVLLNNYLALAAALVAHLFPLLKAVPLTNSTKPITYPTNGLLLRFCSPGYHGIVLSVLSIFLVASS